MTKEEMRALTSTLKPTLILSEDEKDMFVDVLMTIDFKVCENDFETLQLFFKRIYTGIEALKKKVEECKKEIETLKKQSEVQNPPSPIISESF